MPSRIRSVGSVVARLLIQVAGVAAVTIALLLLVEGGIRILAPQHVREEPLVGERFALEDEVLGLRYVPGARWRVRHPEYDVVYEIGMHGFRGAEPPARSHGTTRVMLLGDSFTFGQGVPLDQTWAELVRSDLAASGRDDIEIVNAGFQGADTRTELVLLRRLFDEYRPDVVVVGFLINDLYTNVPDSLTDASVAASWEERRRQVFQPPQASLRQNVVGIIRSLHVIKLTQRLITRNDAVYTRLYVSAPGRGDFLTVPLSPTARRQLEVTEGLLLQLAAFADSVRIPLIVLSIPQQFQVLYEAGAARDPRVDARYYDRYFRELAARSGFRWIPTLDDFLAEPGGGPFFFRLDGHLTASGNRVVADAFLREVVPAPATPTEVN